MNIFEEISKTTSFPFRLLRDYSDESAFFHYNNLAPKNMRWLFRPENFKVEVNNLHYSIKAPSFYGESRKDCVEQAVKYYKEHLSYYLKNLPEKSNEQLDKEYWKNYWNHYKNSLEDAYKPSLYYLNYHKDLDEYRPGGKLFRKAPLPEKYQRYSWHDWFFKALNPKNRRKDKYKIVRPGYYKEVLLYEEDKVRLVKIHVKPHYKGSKKKDLTNDYWHIEEKRRLLKEIADKEAEEDKKEYGVIC